MVGGLKTSVEQSSLNKLPPSLSRFPISRYLHLSVMISSSETQGLRPTVSSIFRRRLQSPQQSMSLLSLWSLLLCKSVLRYHIRILHTRELSCHVRRLKVGIFWRRRRVSEWVGGRKNSAPPVPDISNAFPLSLLFVLCFFFSKISCEYIWTDSQKKSFKVPAPQYIDYVMTYIQNMVDDEATFPTKSGKLRLKRTDQKLTCCFAYGSHAIYGVPN